MTLKTSITSGEKKLQDGNFPVYFSIILTNGFKLENLNIHGYYDIYTFFSGRPDKIMESYDFDWSGNKSNINGKNSMCLFYHYWTLLW